MAHSDPSRPLLDTARGAARALLGLAYPDLCVGCERRVAPDQLICDACLPVLPRPEPGDADATFTRWPVAERPTRAVALWRYDADGAVQRIQRALKYDGRTDAAAPLGVLLGDVLDRDASLPRQDVVVPIPLADTRQLERGYNQAEVLAIGVAERLGIPHRPDALTRTRATRSQARLDAAARRDNVDGAFVASPDLDGLRILLIDDVLTTGATLAAATVALRAVGADVSVAVLALADRTGG